jgi:hypothetical protein
MILPLPLAAVGGVGGATTSARTSAGVSLAVAAVALRENRLFAFWAPTIPALAALVLLPHAGNRLRLLRADPSLR